VPLVEKCVEKNVDEGQLKALTPEAIASLYSPDLFALGSGYQAFSSGIETVLRQALVNHGSDELGPGTQAERVHEWGQHRILHLSLVTMLAISEAFDRAGVPGHLELWDQWETVPECSRKCSHFSDRTQLQLHALGSMVAGLCV